MTPPEQTGHRWIKAQRSYSTGACVEVTSTGEAILVRNSRDPRVEIRYTPAEMDAFFDGVKRGEFDHLLPPG